MKYLVLHVAGFMYLLSFHNYYYNKYKFTMYLRQNKLPEFQIFGIDPKVFIDIFGQS
jgi:hypothetical protein